MILHVVRHAIAAPRGTAGMPDEKRPLTEEGIRKMQQAAAGLNRLGIRPDLILSSPLARALATAEIVRRALKGGTEIKVVSGLAPAAKREEAYAQIRKCQKLDQLMLVGHQPSLGELAGAIAFGSPDCSLELKKGSLCSIEIDRVLPEPRGTLISLVPPSVLRELSRKNS
ncbi:MAG: phosphohistidine phosphatase SixA [Acidobacteria bacterium]|nr:phosphohistidine phosphatase SixA [Acidobacteriota bacterium]